MRLGLGNTLTKNNIIGSLDADAKAYIAAVEAADGQTLESGVKKAINNFVKGCKDDAIWDAIKASCILAGARTLSGALVPLKGTAPTNFNFVSGDYNRETGLIGNGTTKHLDTNRNNNADPQNSKHLSVFRSVGPLSAGGGLIGNSTNQNGASWIFDNFASNLDTIRVNQNSSATGLEYGSGAVFVGANRGSSSSISIRIGSTTTTSSIVSSTPSNENLLVLRGVSQYSNARVSFYSIGESLDMSKFQPRVSTLIDDLAAAIP